MKGDTMKDTRIQLHWAAQAASLCGATLLPKQSDDSHHAFTWSDAREALVQSIGCGIRIRDLSLLWKDEVCPLTGRTLEDAFRFYEERVGQMLPRPGEGLPPHSVASGATFKPDANDLLHLAALYSDAAALLEDVRAKHHNAGPVRCWPHHFDIATLIMHGGERTTGIGFVPGDMQHPEPYWYVTPWPYPDAATLRMLSRGRWNTEKWIGAVHPAADRATIAPFLEEAISAL